MRLRSPRTEAAVAFNAAGRPSSRTRWREARWCALDLELTGLDPSNDEIIAIGAVPIEDGRLMLGESRYTLVRTERRSEHSAVLVHKLRVADLADAPPLEDALELVMELLAGRVPVFHTAVVERTFLTPLLSALRVRLPAPADTEVLGRLLMASERGERGAEATVARPAGRDARPVRRGTASRARRRADDPARRSSLWPAISTRSGHRRSGHS